MPCLAENKLPNAVGLFHTDTGQSLPVIAVSCKLQETNLSGNYKYNYSCEGVFHRDNNFKQVKFITYYYTDNKYSGMIDKIGDVGIVVEFRIPPNLPHSSYYRTKPTFNYSRISH